MKNNNKLQEEKFSFLVISIIILDFNLYKLGSNNYTFLKNINDLSNTLDIKFYNITKLEIYFPDF